MRISRRKFLGTTAGMAAGLALGRLDGLGEDASAAGSLTVWGFSGAIEGVQSQIPSFKRKYPNVNVSVRVLGYDDIHTNLLNAIVAGSGAPDLATIDVSRLASYADGLTPLNSERAKYQHQFVPPTVSLASYKGKFYGTVTDSEPMGMLYRKDIWDKYGIKPGNINTWSDLAAASQHTYSASNGKQHLYALTSNDTALFEVLAVEQGFGGYFFDYTDTKVIVDQPKMIEAANVLKQLFNAKGVVQNPNGAYTGNELTALLKKGMVATCVVAPGWYPQTLVQNMPEQSGKWRLMRAPAIRRGGRRAGYQYPTILVIPKQSSQEKQAWALELMGLTNGGARYLYNKFHVLPAWTPLFNQLMQQPDKFFGGQKVVQVWNAIAHDTPKIMFGKGFAEAQTITGKYLDQILHGRTSADKGMHDAAREIRSKLHKG